MDSRDLVELAAVAATHGPVLIAESTRLSENGMQNYWTASKCRLDRWSHTIASFYADQLKNRRPPPVAWQSLQPTLEETLTGEMLTRVWAAIATAHDQRQGNSEAEPLVRSVYLGHMEARNRVLRLLVQAPKSVAAQVETLNMLRRRCERWTDVLLAHLLNHTDVTSWAFDAQRAHDFADGFRRQHQAGMRHAGWDMTLGALSAAFQSAVVGPSPNRDLNASIAASVLACFPSGLLDTTGKLGALWMTRITQTTNDAQEMVEELLSLEFD